MGFLCDICGFLFNHQCNLRRHIKEQHQPKVQSLKCNFCQQLFLRPSNLKRHYKNVHKLDEMNVSEEMDRTQGDSVTCNRDFYHSSKKPVYVLSDLYEDISSDEDEVIRMEETPQNCDLMEDLEIISVNTSDFGDQADDLLDFCELEDERTVVAASDEEDQIEEDLTDERNVEFRDTSSEQSSDHSDTVRENSTVTKSTVCLLLNKTTRNYPDGTMEVSRDTHVVYSEDLTPSDIDYEGVASEVLSEIPRHFEEGNVRFACGDFTHL
ncbi:MDS1 and EVI1 complex locus protein EVI1-B-like [Saccostrea cucullata]|uniref:MDS1 and EVI1 complex locus protein EVI1-B-like n=1 Tax=Saccostrea cuccullata TaxID=36930 RepID=UPI002ED08980